MIAEYAALLDKNDSIISSIAYSYIFMRNMTVLSDSNRGLEDHSTSLSYQMVIDPLCAINDCLAEDGDFREYFFKIEDFKYADFLPIGYIGEYYLSIGERSEPGISRDSRLSFKSMLFVHISGSIWGHWEGYTYKLATDFKEYVNKLIIGEGFMGIDEFYPLST